MQLKQLLSGFLLLFLSTNLTAGHERGGVIITYKNMGAVTGDSMDYEVTAFRTYATQGISPPSSFSISLESSCFSNQNVSLSKQSASGTNGLNLPANGSYCDPYNTTTSYWGIAIYKGNVKLPGLCADFTFKANGGFGAMNMYDNLQSSFDTPLYETELDNTLGPNDSPQLDFEDIISLRCLNQPMTLYNYQKTNGDSLFFDLGAPRKSGSGNQVFAFSTGYSATNPINATGGVNLNPENGRLTTTPTSVGSFLITLNWEEYRRDTTGVVQRIGSGQIQTEVVVSGNCVSRAFQLVQNSGNNQDSVACGDTSLILTASRKFVSSSVSPDISEFNLVAQLNPGLHVTDCRVRNDSSLNLILSAPIQSQEQIQLSVMAGSDSNTISSICGKELSAGAQTINYVASQGLQPQAVANYQRNFLQVNFDATNSINSDLSVWNYGDGSPLDTASSPSHTFQQARNYSVLLIALTDCGETDSTTINLEVCVQPDTAFSTSEIGDSLQFSINNPQGGTIYEWDLGDGNSATASSVTHLYSDDSTYVVSLLAYNNCGDTVTTQRSINVCSKPNASWTATRSNTTGGYVINFDGTASSNFDTFMWDFGDGNTNSSSLTPSHLYVGDPASYRVTLTLFNDCGKSDSLAYTLAEIGQPDWELYSFDFYPNPVQEQLNISLAEPGRFETVSIYNSAGQVLFNQDIRRSETELQLSLEELKPGFYVIELDGANKVARPFIKR